MPITKEQAEAELKKRRATKELARRRPPDFGPIAIPRKKLPGVWEYDKQLDQLLGDPDRDIESFIPWDVRYDFGRVVGMTEKPDETRTKMQLSLLYKSLAGVEPKISFNLMDEFNKIIFDKPIDVKKAMAEYSDYYLGSKKYTTAIKHGLKNLGVRLVQTGVGAAKMEAEIGGRIRKKFWDVIGIEQPEYQKKIDETLANWSNDMYAAIGEYYRENKAELVQIVPGTGFRGTLFQYAKQPQAFVQSLVESSGIILEGLAGTMLGGPGGGIIAMGLPMSFEVYPDVRAEDTPPLPALAQSMLTGMGEAVIEQWTLSRKLGLMKNFRKYVAEGFPKMIWEGVKIYFRGTAEEGTQEFNRNFWRWVFTDRAQQWKENVAESMAIGGPMELAMAGGFSAVGAAVGPTIPKDQQMERIRQIREAVEQSAILDKTEKAEIKQELKTVREDVRQDVYKPEPVEAEKPPTEAITAPEKPAEPITKPEAVEVPEAPAKAEILDVEKGTIIARSFPRERMEVAEGQTWQEYRLRKLTPKERGSLIEKRMYSLPEIGLEPIAIEVRRIETEKGKKTIGEWGLWDVDKDAESIVKKMVSDTEYQQAESLHPIHKWAVETGKRKSELTTKIDRLKAQIKETRFDKSDVKREYEDKYEEELKKLRLHKAVAEGRAPSLPETKRQIILDLKKSLREQYKKEIASIEKQIGQYEKELTQLKTRKFEAKPPAKAEPAKVEKPAEKRITPIQKIIKVEKKVIPKVSKEKFTPSEVQKETKAEIPESDSETQNATNLIEGYWREYDERELEINVAAIKNQQAITKALGKKTYLPESDIELAKMSQAMMLYIDLKEHPSGHQFAEELSKLQKEIYDLSKNLPAKIQKIADSIIKQNREFGAMAVDKEVIANARENYIAHLWQKPEREEVYRARFRQKTARAKARTLEGGIMEGWAKGKTLRVKDVTLAAQIAQSQINQALVGKEMLKLGKKWGLLSHKQPTDWIRVEHPGFTTWKWSGKAEKAKTYGRNFFVTEKGDLMERVPVYAEPELGKKLNKVFSPSALYKVPGIETISRYNAQIKSTILFTSLYHHQAFLRSYAFGSRGLNPKEAYTKGRQAIMNMTPEVRLLVRNGLTIGRIQDYDPRMIEGEQTIWGRALAKTKPTEAIRKKLVALRKRQERFLFNKMGPALKIQAGLLELKAALKRNQAELESGEITADEIAVAIANLMNNDFGGLHLGRMGRSQTAQHIFRLLALAPDWTESNVRSAVDAFRKGETGYLHRMFWGRIAVKGLGATILFNLLLSAFDDDDFAERYKKAWEIGRLRWLDIDITPIYEAMGGSDDKRKYFSLLGHFRDPVKFTVHPFISAKHKGSVVSRIMLDMMIGQDWAGRQYTTIGELTGITEDGKFSGRLVRYAKTGAKPIEPAQIPSYALYEIRSAMPIPIQNIVAFLGGEMDAFDAITKSLGLMTTTTYPEKKTIRKRIKRSE